MNNFLEAASISHLYELFTVPGEMYFALNLIYVKFFDAVHKTAFGQGGKYGRLKQREIGTLEERANDYSATPRCLINTLRQLNITNQDSIIDMGCGKGLAMYYMGKFPFRRIAGIELSEKLVAVAKINLKILHVNKKKYNVICADAGLYDGYDNYNFFYIYNSFPKQVIREVVGKITESIDRKPRKVIILYLYPEFPREIVRDRRFMLIKKGTKYEIRKGMHIYVNREYRDSQIFIER